MQSLIWPQAPSAAARARLAELMPERDRIADIEYAKDGETWGWARVEHYFRAFSH